MNNIKGLGEMNNETEIPDVVPEKSLKVGRLVPPFASSPSRKFINDNEIIYRISKAWAALDARVTIWMDEPVKTDRGPKMGSIRSDLFNGMPRR